MKLYFISDLHGCLTATRNALALFEQLQAQHIILLGDVLYHGPRNPVPVDYNPAEVAKLLNQYGSKIIAVRGNCDSEVDQMLLDFPIMSDVAWVLLPTGQRMCLTHGHIYNADKADHLAEGDVLCHGHTHIPVAEYQQGRFIFNPGSITFPRQDYAASVGLYSQGEFQVIDLDGKPILSGQL